MDFESLQKAVDALVELWEQFTIGLNEAANAIAKVFEQLNEEQQKAKSDSSPRKYGMSLVSNSAMKSSVKSYNYIPSVRRNLPYQRRRF